MWPDEYAIAAIIKVARDHRPHPSANDSPCCRSWRITTCSNKPKKVKLIRDSFTMPFFEYDFIDALRVKALNSKVMVKKNEWPQAAYSH